MSKATSIRGERYEQNFRAGFVRKNATHMRNRKFKADGGDVFGINKRGKKADRIGDIDGYYISTSQNFFGIYYHANTDWVTKILSSKRVLIFFLS